MNKYEFILLRKYDLSYKDETIKGCYLETLYLKIFCAGPDLSSLYLTCGGGDIKRILVISFVSN